MDADTPEGDLWSMYDTLRQSTGLTWVTICIAFSHQHGGRYPTWVLQKRQRHTTATNSEHFTICTCSVHGEPNLALSMRKGGGESALGSHGDWPSVHMEHGLYPKEKKKKRKKRKRKKPRQKNLTGDKSRRGEISDACDLPPHPPQVLTVRISCAVAGVLLVFHLHKTSIPLMPAS